MTPEETLVSATWQSTDCCQSFQWGQSPPYVREIVVWRTFAPDGTAQRLEVYRDQDSGRVRAVVTASGTWVNDENAVHIAWDDILDPTATQPPAPWSEVESLDPLPWTVDAWPDPAPVAPTAPIDLTRTYACPELGLSALPSGHFEGEYFFPDVDVEGVSGKALLGPSDEGFRLGDYEWVAVPAAAEADRSALVAGGHPWDAHADLLVAKRPHFDAKAKVRDDVRLWLADDGTARADRLWTRTSAHPPPKRFPRTKVRQWTCEGTWTYEDGVVGFAWPDGLDCPAGGPARLESGALWLGDVRYLGAE